MLKCGICGCEFNAVIERHYISRDEGQTGFENPNGFWIYGGTASGNVHGLVYNTTTA